MKIGFYIKIKVGKFLANIISSLYRNKEKRHKVREKFNPLNPGGCVSYLKKHLVSESIVDWDDNEEGNEYIWVCWFQGIENAPKIVKRCVQSIEQCKEDYQVVLIKSDNFQEYVDIPPIILDKWQRGIIDNTHLSDILRVHLLARYGGVWIDSTCLMLSPIPKHILDSDFFIFHSHGEFEYTLIQSCFIRCRKNNYIMRKWMAAIDNYWTQENIRINYFLLHLIFVALLQTDEKFMKEFNNVPVVNGKEMHLILEKMIRGEEFSDELISAARETCFIQKLTYKFPSQLLEQKNTIATILSQ